MKCKCQFDSKAKRDIGKDQCQSQDLISLTGIRDFQSAWPDSGRMSWSVPWAKVRQ